MYTFVREWLENPQWWFSTDNSFDEIICEKFEYLLDSNDFEIERHAIGCVLIYDQIPRHVYRNMHCNHIIEYFLQKALRCVNTYLSNDSDGVMRMPVNELVFFLLPLRHANDMEMLILALKLAWKRLLVTENVDDIALLKRFITASLKRAPFHQQKFISNLCQPNALNMDTNELHSSKSIGEFSQIPKHFILSLSGGSDSMICSFMLRKVFPNARIVALMINYCNRDTCDNEVEFVKTWCEKLNIELYVRAIAEIHRPTCMKYEMREIYESYTRNVRYNSYKCLWEMVGYNKMENIPVVILGHNKDDRFENIMTNMTHQMKYDNLCGMEYECVSDGVRFLRPLLEVEKSDIYSYANMHKIPHLPCSTPVWSQRGKIRNNVVPVLNDWDELCVPGMFHMSNIMQDLYGVLKNSVNDFKKDFIIVDENSSESREIHIDTLSESFMFWKEFFGFGVSIKSIKQYIINLMHMKKMGLCNKTFVLSKNKNLVIIRKSETSCKIVVRNIVI